MTCELFKAYSNPYPRKCHKCRILTHHLTTCTFEGCETTGPNHIIDVQKTELQRQETCKLRGFCFVGISFSINEACKRCQGFIGQMFFLAAGFCFAVTVSTLGQPQKWSSIECYKLLGNVTFFVDFYHVSSIHIIQT